MSAVPPPGSYAKEDETQSTALHVDVLLRSGAGQRLLGTGSIMGLQADTGMVGQGGRLL
jgi:hypothetical protein